MSSHYSRRKFVGKLIGLGGLGYLPRAWSSASKISPGGLSFLNLHTGESLHTAIGHGAEPQSQDLEGVSRVLRDHRSGDIYPIDPELLKLLVRLQAEVGVAGPFHIISGYRSPATNSKLRAAGRKVATKSLHLQGKAVDIRLPGCNLNDLRSAALALKCGGVGYYPGSNFVHVDTGRVRFW